MDGTACGLKIFMKELFEKDWDYSEHAKFYSYRPNYASKVIDMLMIYVQGRIHIKLLMSEPEQEIYRHF